ncbi:MAG: dipeptide epimerase [Chloroflexi bacterium]|nr:dipeptide epimerase [Chloroflexota bacterium]
MADLPAGGAAGLAVESETLRLALRDPFRIARDEPDQEATTVIVTGSDGQSEGLGEAFPVAYYGETVGTIAAVLPALVAAVDDLGPIPSEADAARSWLARTAAAAEALIGHNDAAKCGLDICLHDLVARRVGLPLHALLELPAEIPPTDFSLGLDEPEVVAERARKAARFPALKVKLGGRKDVQTLEAVRAVYGGPLRVDANTGWEAEEGARLLPELVRLGVELIEQPFPAHDHGRLGWLQERSRLPIVADESAVTALDLDALVGVVAGVNVKLTKCGGIGPALRMIARARELGFKVMLGCMEETSVGIAAAAALGSQADWIDLDGNLLLAEDPFEGLRLDEGCRWVLPGVPGLGVRRRN